MYCLAPWVRNGPLASAKKPRPEREALPVRSCRLDGELIVFDEAGLAALRLVGALSCVEPRDRGG